MVQLLKEPETKTSLATPDHLNIVGLACAGFLLLLSRSCCQARNSCISCGTWTTWKHCSVAMLMRAASVSSSVSQHNTTLPDWTEGAEDGADWFVCSFEKYMVCFIQTLWSSLHYLPLWTNTVRIHIRLFLIRQYLDNFILVSFLWSYSLYISQINPNLLAKRYLPHISLPFQCISGSHRYEITTNKKAPTEYLK